MRAGHKHYLRAATFLAAGISAATFATPAYSQDRVYTGSGADWTTAPNWNGNDAPDSFGENAVFQNNGAPTSVSITTNVGVGTVRFDANGPARVINLGAFLGLTGGVSNQSGVVQTININGAVFADTTLQMYGLADFTGTQSDVLIGSGFLQVLNQANATSANAILNGGVISLETDDGTATLGALSGNGTVVSSIVNGGIANQQLTVGGLNLSTAFAGQIVQDAGSTLSVVKAGIGTLTLTGSNSYSGTTTIGAGTLQVGNGGAAGTLGSGNVINNSVLQFNRSDSLAVGSVVSGTGSLSLLNGSLTLSGANSYSGTTTVQSGTLIAANASALGTIAGGTLVQSGASLAVDDGLTVANEALTINGTGIANSGALRGIGNSAYAGVITLGSNSRINSGGDFTIASSIDGGGNSLTVGGAGNLYFGGINAISSLTKDGAGIAVMQGANDYSGPTTVNAGTLQLASGNAIGNGSTVSVNGSGVLRVSASEAIGSLSGSGSLVLQSGATLTTGGDNSSTIFSGNTVEQAGTGGITKIGAGTLTLSGSNSYTGLTTISGGMLQIGNGGTNGSILGSVATSAGTSVLFNRSNAYTFAGVISGGGAVTQIGSGTTILTGANIFSGGTVVNGGTLEVTATGSAGSGVIRVDNATLRVRGTRSFANNINFANGVSSGIEAENGQTLTLTGTLGFSSGQTTFGSAGATGTIVANPNGNIGFHPGGSIVVAGGTLRAGSDRLGVFTSVHGSTTVDAGATLDYNGQAGEPVAIKNLQGAGTLLNDGGTTTINTGTFSGRIRGTQSLVIGATQFAPAGTLTLSGTNDYSGGTTINTGATLALSGAEAIGSGQILLGAGAILRNGNCGCGTLTLGNAITVTGGAATIDTDGYATLLTGNLTGGNLIFADTAGGGSTTLTGTNSYGNTVIGAGATLRIGNGGTAGSLGTGSVNLAGSQLVFDRSNVLTAANLIAGNGVLRQSGVGKTVLAGHNVAGQNFTGSVFVDAGSLAIDGNFGDVTGNSAQLILGVGGTLAGSGTFFGNVDAQNGTLAPGNSPGTLTIAGNLALGAATALNFELGEAGTVGGPNNDLVVVGGNLTLDGTLNTIAAAPAYGPGYYRLFNYGGTLTDNGLDMGSIASGYSPTILTNIDGQVNLLLGDSAGQTIQYWDGADAVGASTAVSGNGGAGVWSSGVTNWTTATGYGVNDAWRNHVAVFAGPTGGTVTVEGAQTFQELRFDAAGYTLQAGAGGALSTTGGFSVIDVGAPLAAINVGISGSGGLTKTGTGTLVLGAVSDYAGVTTVSDGTLQIAPSGSIGGAGVANSANLVNAGTIVASITNNAALASTGVITGALSNNGTVALAGQLNGNLSNAGTVTLTGTTTGVSALSQNSTGSLDLAGYDTDIGSIGGAGLIQLGGATLTAGGNQGSTSYAGAISGAGGLTKTGTGTLTLDAATSYIGATTVSQGVLQVGSTGSIGGSGVTNNAGLANAGTINTGIVNSGSLMSTGIINGTLANSGTVAIAGQLIGTIDNSGSVTLTGVTTGIAMLTQTSAGSFDMGGFSTAIGTLSGGGAIDTGTNTDAALTIGNATASTFAGSIAGSGQLIKTGAGTLTLSGANSLSEGTLISEGALRLGDGGASGSLTGPVAVDGTLIIDRSDLYALTNALSGSGSVVQAGSGTTVLGGPNGMTGGFLISNGRLRGDAAAFGANGIRADGTAEFAQAAAGSFAGQISGSGVVEKTGTGRLTLTGSSSFTGQTRLLAGELTVSGSLAQSALTAAGGTRLSGTGTVGSVTLANGTTIAPGNSIGTVNVNGDITFAPGSIYEVEVDPTGIASDLIAATGSAILNGGAVVHIGLNGNYRPQATYTILSAAGGVQGTFADVSPSFAFLDPTLGYGANTVTLTLERNDVDFSDIAVTPNQNQVANGLGQLSFGNALFDTVLLLDENGARLAFDRLSGEIYPSLLSGFVQDSRFVRGAAVDRMRHFGAAADAEPGVRFWMQGLGSRGHLGGDGNAHRVKQDSAGFLMGVDAIADETVQLGAFGGYQQGGANVRAVSSEADIDTYHVGVYAGADLVALGLRAGYAFSWHDADVTRQIAFGGFRDVAKGRFDASTAQAFAEIGYRIDFGTARIEPFAQIAQIWVDSERMNEVGGAAALRVARGKMSTGVSTLGARLDQDFSIGSLEASLKLSGGWRHAFSDHLPVMASRFQGSALFTIAGTPIAHDAFAADIGLGLVLSSRTRLDLSYSGDVASKSESHAGRATLSWIF